MYLIRNIRACKTNTVKQHSLLRLKAFMSSIKIKGLNVETCIFARRRERGFIYGLLGLVTGLGGAPDGVRWATELVLSSLGFIGLGGMLGDAFS